MTQLILNKIFGTINSANKKETFSKFELSYFCEDLKVLRRNLNQSNYNSLNDILSQYNYKWDISVENYSFSTSQDSFETMEIDEENEMSGVVVLTIHKEGNKILIIDNNIFNDFIENLNLESFLSFLKNKNFPITFINEGAELTIGNEYEEKMNTFLSHQCNFRNYSQFPFSPEIFNFDLQKNKTSTPLTELIQKASLIYCLIYIFDSSEINANKIDLVISGNKTIKYSLDIKEVKTSLLPYYYKIYDWIYSEKTKIEDKIGLSKNIITAYLRDDSLNIDNSVFHSIISSNQIYIKGNISKYFEVRNKIIEQIEQTIDKVNQSLDTFFSNFQKSIFVFVSFFLSVFIYKISRKSGVENVFTRETSIIGLGFIILSIIIFIASYLIYRYDIKRVKERYENVKTRFQDVLIQEDIDKIINNDFEHNNEIKFLRKRVNVYIILWVFTIIIFISSLFLASDYLETTVIFSCLKSLITC